MDNITIGVVGPNWRPVEVSRFYAQRVGSGEYAFGATPADALRQLELRESAVDLRFDEDLAAEIAFLTLGAAAFLRGFDGINLDVFGGYMGFVGEITRHAPMLVEQWKTAESAGFDGVWLYDVTERFGREWAEAVFTRVSENPVDRLQCIIDDEMKKWS